MPWPGGLLAADACRARSQVASLQQEGGRENRTHGTVDVKHEGTWYSPQRPGDAGAEPREQTAGNVITIQLPATLKARLARGHPWVYRNHISRSPDLPSGAWVRVRSGRFSAIGLWDAESPIAVRLYSRRAEPSAEWVADRVAEAWATRAPVRATATTGYRWVYGESDGLPGIVVDLYGEFCLIRTYVESVEGLVPWVADALHAHASLLGILWRRRNADPESLWGRLPPHDHVVEEHRLLFHADLFAGQKTGLYFDQRENRMALAPVCAGKSVLDCFCYTGGFGLYAARAGASCVTACDAARGAVEAAERNFALNGLDPAQHTFVVQDCFEFLEQIASAGRRFDVLVLDPPSFARDRQSRHAAERAYVRLNRLALDCVQPGGILASASCTSQVSPHAFRQALAEAARQARKRLLLVHEAGQAVDHPVPPHFPEARYLKFVVSRVLEWA
jgi:23S rRNA (cytosine1962-C5)-methyltransferase